MPSVTLTAFPLNEAPVAETLTAVPVVSEFPVTLVTFPASCVLVKFARLADAPPAPCASTLRMLPVKDCARTFTAPTE